MKEILFDLKWILDLDLETNISAKIIGKNDIDGYFCRKKTGLYLCPLFTIISFVGRRIPNVSYFFLSLNLRSKQDASVKHEVRGSKATENASEKQKAWTSKLEVWKSESTE